METVIGKVSCFVLHPRDHRLLVFAHTDHPEAGIQVPAGTIEAGEDPAVAAVREAEEETGFGGFRIVRLLDRRLLCEVRNGRDETHDRRYYHLSPPHGLPEEWDHGEGDPDTEEWIRFHFFWLGHDQVSRLLTRDHAEVFVGCGLAQDLSGAAG